VAVPPQTRRRSAGRSRIVIAVCASARRDELHPHLAPGRQRRAVVGRDVERRLHVAGVEEAVEDALVAAVGDEVEVPALEEGGPHVARGPPAVVVDDREADVDDVERQRVAVDEEKQHRHAEQRERGAQVPTELEQLLHRDRQRSPDHAAPPDP
jgi:hypothetical protein